MKKIILTVFCFAMSMTHVFALNNQLHVSSQLTKWDLSEGGMQNVCLLYDKHDPSYAGVFKVNMDTDSTGPIVLQTYGDEHSSCNHMTLQPGQSVTCNLKLESGSELCVIWNSPTHAKVHGTYSSQYIGY